MAGLGRHADFYEIAKTMPVVTAVVCFLSTQNTGPWTAARRKLVFFILTRGWRFLDGEVTAATP
jgi:hypothetical protein